MRIMVARVIGLPTRRHNHTRIASCGDGVRAQAISRPLVPGLPLLLRHGTHFATDIDPSIRTAGLRGSEGIQRRLVGDEVGARPCRPPVIVLRARAPSAGWRVRRWLYAAGRDLCRSAREHEQSVPGRMVQRDHRAVGSGLLDASCRRRLSPRANLHSLSIRVR